MPIPAHLYGLLPYHESARWKMDLFWHTLGEPLTRRFPQLSWTRGRVTSDQQAALAAGPLGYKVAAGPNPSQHELAEAGDADAPRPVLWRAFLWAYEALPYWQLILYAAEPEPRDGIGESLHISMLSEVRTIERKCLVYVNRSVHRFNGSLELPGGQILKI